MDFDPRDRDDDPRDVEMPWVDARSLDDRELDDPRSSDIRERDVSARTREVDPRDPFIEDLELPRGLEREVVFDGDHRYELNGDDSRYARDDRRVSGRFRTGFPRGPRGSPRRPRAGLRAICATKA